MARSASPFFRCRAVAAVLWLHAFAVASACAQGVTADEPARLMNDLMSGTVPVGGAFTLTDTAGQQRSLAQFQGKVVLLVFGYTSCPDVCPSQLTEIARLIDSMGVDGGSVQPIFITLDPERDTARVLRDYARAFHPSVLALRGSAAQTRAVATAYKVSYRRVPATGTGRYLLDHTAFTFVLDAAGKYVAFFPPGTSAERMAVMVRPLLPARALSDP